MLDLPFFLFDDSIRSFSDLSCRFPQGVDPPSVRFIQMQSPHLQVQENDHLTSKLHRNEWIGRGGMEQNLGEVD
jgi:hypothetical protein